MIVATLSDLRSHLDPLMGSAGWGDPNALEGDSRRDSDEVLEVAADCLCCRDHPEWGEDWDAWLAALDLNGLQEEALRILGTEVIE